MNDPAERRKPTANLIRSHVVEVEQAVTVASASPPEFDRLMPNATGNVAPESGNGKRAGSDQFATFIWGDPDFALLDDRRGDLPEFPISAFHGLCRQWVERAAHAAAVTPAHVAVPLLGVASSLVGSARRVGATKAWSEPMTLWTAVIGNSGAGKTPGLGATKKCHLIYRAR